MERIIPATLGVLLDDNLLWLVFGEMEPRGLVRAMRVCRMWRDLIKYSRKIQERLFLKAQVEYGSMATTHADPDPELDFASLRSFGIRPNGLIPELSPCCITRFGYDMTELFVRLHPLCVMAIPPHRIEPLLLRPEASWCNMLTHQPPILYLSWFTIILDESGAHIDHFCISYSIYGGLTMGMLFNMVSTAANTTPAQPKSIGHIRLRNIPGDYLTRADVSNLCKRKYSKHADEPSLCEFVEPHLTLLRLVRLKKPGQLPVLRERFLGQILNLQSGHSFSSAIPGLFPEGAAAMDQFVVNAYHIS